MCNKQYRNGWGLVCIFLLISLLSASAADAGQPPNIVLVLVDNLGYGDIGCFGSKKHRTPHNRPAGNRRRQADKFLQCCTSLHAIAREFFNRVLSPPRGIACRLQRHAGADGGFVAGIESQRTDHCRVAEIAWVCDCMFLANGIWVISQRFYRDNTASMISSDCPTAKTWANWRHACSAVAVPPLPLIEGETVIGGSD